jgi:3'-5' exonuclease
MNSVIVWDIETVPDLKGFAAANGHAGTSDDEIRAVIGDKFPKHIYHSIICIGALVAHRKVTVPGLSMRLAHHTWESGPRRR